jgi:hypothetical protein
MMSTAICVAIAGCGASSSLPGIVAHSSSSPPITRSRATAYARAVNLRAADLPGMQLADAEGVNPAPTEAGREEARCNGSVNPNLLLVNAHSASFTGGTEPEHEEIRSEIEVMPNATLAARDNAANRSPRAIACAKHFLALQLDAQDGARVHYGPVTISPLSVPLQGATGSFAFRLEVPILGVPTAIESKPPHLFVDAFGFLSGPSEVALLTTGFPAPVPEATDKRLLSLLYSRAQAHKL